MEQVKLVSVFVKVVKAPRHRFGSILTIINWYKYRAFVHDSSHTETRTLCVCNMLLGSFQERRVVFEAGY